MRVARSKLLAVSLLLLATCVPLANVKHGSWVEPVYRVKEIKLSNGLRVIVEPDTGSPMMSMALAVGAGSEKDPLGKEGLAHLVEHLAFRSRHGEAFTVQEALEYSGAAGVNAFTENDLTSYVANAPREALGALLKVAARQVRGPDATFDPGVFEAEREVVRSELAEASDLGGHGLLRGWTLAAVYPSSHPYARPTGGTQESMASLVPADVAAFVQSHYRPQNATLVLTGGVDLAQLEQLLGEVFPVIGVPVQRPPPATAALPAPVLKPPPVLLRRFEAPVEDPELYVLWPLPPGYGKDAATNHELVSFARTMLLRGERSIETLSVQYVSGVHGSLLLARAVLPADENPDKAFERLRTRLDEGAALVEEQGIGMYRSQQLNSLLQGRGVGTTLNLSDPMERAQLRARLTQLTGDVLAFSRWRASVQPTDFTPSLRYLRAPQARAIYVKPKGTLHARTLALVAELDGRESEGASASVHFPADAVKKGLRRLDERNLRSERLANGLEVVIYSARYLPSTSLVLSLPGGTSLSDPAGAAELGSYLAEPKAKDMKGPFWSGALRHESLTPDRLEVTLEGQPQNLEAMLSWLRGSTLGWEVDSGLVPWFGREVLPNLRARAERPQATGVRSFWSAVYGAHPYARRSQPASFDGVGDGQIERWLARVYAPDHAVLAIAGSVDPEEALRFARAAFGSWPAKGEKVPAPPAAAPSARSPEVLITDVPGAVQTRLDVGCLLPPASPRQSAVNAVAGRVLEQRLSRALRERTGLSYGVHGGAASLWGGSSHLTLETNVRADDLERTLALVKTQLGAEAFEPDELSHAAWDLLRQRNLRLMSSSAIATSMARAKHHGAGPEALNGEAELFTSVNEGEVKAALGACQGNLTVLLTGAGKVLHEAATRAGWPARDVASAKP